MNEETSHPLIRDTAHWLTNELFDELTDPEGIKPHLIIWLSGFRYVNRIMYRNGKGSPLLMRARREAGRYYEGHLRRSYHSWQDKSWYLFLLTRALLLACDCFDRSMTDDPQDFLRVEALQCGYYACLIEAVKRMIFDMGMPDKRMPYDPPITRLSQPFLPLN